MGIGMMGPGCCCDCIIAEDDFAVDSLATDWDVRNGTPTISGGVLNAGAGTNLLVHNTAAGAGATAVYAAVDFTCTSTTETGQLIIAYVDDNNYWFLEGQAGATNGTLKLFERAGGTNTQRGATGTVQGFTTSNGATFKLAYADGQVIAYAKSSTNDACTIAYAATVTVASTQAGIGGSEVGTVTFNNFTFQKHDFEQDGCPTITPGDCKYCTDGLLPPRLQVDITNWADATCTDCDTWNGTFILDGAFANFLACGWTYSGSGNFCGTTPIMSVTISTSGANFRVMFGITDSGGGGHVIQFWKDVASPTTFDCSTWNAFDLNTGAFVSATVPCDVFGSTVKITALDP